MEIPPELGCESAFLRRVLAEPLSFQTLFDALPVQVVIKSMAPQTWGQFVTWNRTAEEWLGIRRDEIIGRTDADFFPADQAAFFAERDLETMRAGKPVEIADEQITTRSQGNLHLRTIKTPIFDENGAPLALLAVSEDITRRVQAMETLDLVVHELRNERNLLQALFDHLPICAFAKSARAEDEGAFIFWNRMMEEFHDIPAEAIVGRKTSDLYPAEIAKAFTDQDREVLRSGVPLNIPLETFTSPHFGERLMHTLKAPVFDADGQPLAILGVSEDITDRIQAEAERTKTAELLRQLSSRVPGAIYQLCVQPNGSRSFTFVSDRVEEIYGIPPGEFLQNQSVAWKCVHPEDITHVAAAETTARAERSMFQCEFRIFHRDGQIRWLQSNASPQTIDDCVYWHGFVMDITARKQVEAQLREAKEMAEKANRAKGDFLAMMSHEIRTPLNGVLGFAELLAETHLEGEQREYLQTIRESGRSLLRVLNDILDYSKIESGKLSMEHTPISLRHLVQNAVDTYRVQADRKRLRLHCELGADVPDRVLADSVRLHQVLTNLVSNAVKFTEAGTVEVTLEHRGTRAGIASLRFIIRDTGIGIAGEHLALLFSPFQQVDASMARRFGGTGLGLAIVERLVTMMEGQIRVASTPSEGTMFVVDLPFPVEKSESAARTLPAAPSPALPARSGAISILLVEDNPVNRRLARLMLERLGHKPDEAVDGHTAVRAAKMHGYDLILMDIQMPGMDGYEAARRILSDCASNAPAIVALTAHAMQSDRERSAAAGMRHHLTKPIQLTELRAVVESCLPASGSSPNA